MINQAMSYSPQYNTSWALCIGINAYRFMPPLCCAVKDAQDVASILVKRLGFLPDHVITLQDQEATYENILAVCISQAMIAS